MIDAYLGDLRLRVEDRQLCYAWRTSFLLRKHKEGDKTKKSYVNKDHALAKNGAIERVMGEYFAREKVKNLFPSSQCTRTTNCTTNSHACLLLTLYTAYHMHARLLGTSMHEYEQDE